MKKLLSISLVLILTLSLTLSAFAVGSDSYGVYSDENGNYSRQIVEPKNPQPIQSKKISDRARMGIFQSTVTLAPNASFTSYQYTKPSGYFYVAGTVIPSTPGSQFKIQLYGSNQVGGSKTLISTVTQAYGAHPILSATDSSAKYQYYNVVVTNTGKVSATTEFGLFGD